MIDDKHRRNYILISELKKNIFVPTIIYIFINVIKWLCIVCQNPLHDLHVMTEKHYYRVLCIN